MSDQESQAGNFGPVKASVVKNGGISDGGDRDMSCYDLEERTRKGYLSTRSGAPRNERKAMFHTKASTPQARRRE